METEKIRTVVLTVVLIGWLAAAIRQSEAQSTDCATTLTPCAAYINATHPPASCCTPLKGALTTQKDCLCNIFNNPSVLKSFGINITDALSLPSRCNITTGAAANFCSAASSPTPAATNTSNTPSTPSGKNAADVIAWSGVSVVMAIMASLVLY